MKKFASIAILLSCFFLFFTPWASACFNIKYVHQGVMGTPVMDLTIVLLGERTPINIYIDTTGYRFTEYSWSFQSGYTYLKWFGPVDPAGMPVDPSIGIPYCTWMYIGWEVGEPPAPVILAYWTDAAGNPIYPDGWIKEMWHEVYPWPNPWLWIYYSIEFDSAAIDSVYYKVFPQPLTLGQMTWENPDLWPPWEQMTPLYVGGEQPLAYGDSIGWALTGVAPGDYMVFVYRGFCNNIFWDFGQHLIEEEGPVYDLWETPDSGNTYFEFGCDILPTIPTIPADFFGPGSDPFDGIIYCKGDPVQTSPPGVLGPTDTIVEREEVDLPTCPSSDSVELQIVELSLVSTAPITVSYYGGSYFEDWDVRVCLSDVTPPPGYAIFDRNCQEGGTFFSEFSIYPRFIFNKVSNPANEIILDFGDQGMDPVNYNTPFDGNWLFDDPGFGVYKSMGGELVSHCWGYPDRPIGPSGVDLIPGLRALPCNDCVTPPSSHEMPFTTFAELDFCARQDVVPPHPGGGPGCDYVVGDVNGSSSYNGLDITYGVNFFKGIGPDPMCPFGSCPFPPCDAFFYCGDVNGSCTYNGLDITYGVSYFKGGPGPMPCAACPPYMPAIHEKDVQKD